METFKLRSKDLRSKTLFMSSEKVNDLLNNTFKRISEIFGEEKKDQYPEGVLLLGSIIEESLTILITIKLIMLAFPSIGKPNFELTSKDMKEMMNYYAGLSFYHKIRTAFILGLIDNVTYKNLESFKEKRNRFIHSFFIEEERPDPQKIYEIASIILNNLRKKLKYYKLLGKF